MVYYGVVRVGSEKIPAALVDVVLLWLLGPGRCRNENRGLDRKEQEHVTVCLLLSLTF